MLFRKPLPMAAPTAVGPKWRILPPDSAGFTAPWSHAAPARGARGLGLERKRGGGQSKTERDKARRKEAETRKGKLRYAKKGKTRKRGRPTDLRKRKEATDHRIGALACYLANGTAGVSPRLCVLFR